MKPSNIYVLTDTHMTKLDELITEIQAVYCDIYSNRGLSLSSMLDTSPAPGLINDAIETNVDFEDILEK